MALEVRLGDEARLTKDIDLGLRDRIDEDTQLRERLIEALTNDPFEDQFVFVPGAVRRLMEDSGGQPTWRTKVVSHLAGKSFGTVQLDVSPRAQEIEQTDRMALPNSLDFAGIETATIEIIDVHRHVAEKFHGMLRQFSDRENTRVRDLADIVILAEHGLIRPALLAVAATEVWEEREGLAPRSLCHPSRPVGRSATSRSPTIRSSAPARSPLPSTLPLRSGGTPSATRRRDRRVLGGRHLVAPGSNGCS